LAHSKLPDYFKKTGFKNPIDENDTAFNYATKRDKRRFDSNLQPGTEPWAEAFQNHEKFKETLSKRWYESAPVDQILPQKFDSNKVLLVAISGDIDHDLLGFHAAHPNQPGRLILQVAPNIMESVDKAKLEPIEVMEYDLTKEQPVKGAKAYYLKRVTYGLSDIRYQTILKNLRPG
jgi:hypothetical protein